MATMHPMCRPSYACHEFRTANGSTAVMIRSRKHKRSSKPQVNKHCSQCAPEECPEYRWPGGNRECPLRANRTPYADHIYRYPTYEYAENREECPHQEAELAWYLKVTGACNARREYKGCRPRCRQFYRPWPTHEYLPHTPELYMIRNDPQEKCCCKEYHGINRLTSFDYLSQW